MTVNFHLPGIPPPRLTKALFKRHSTILENIIISNIERFEQGAESKVFKSRRDDLIIRLKKRIKTRESFENATKIVGRERLLLSIYLEYFAIVSSVEWLPEFNTAIARSILGDNGKVWRKRFTILVTRLYFNFFEKLIPLPFIIDRLLEAYSKNNFANEMDSNNIWHKHRKIIFSLSGPQNIISQIKQGETCEGLVGRFGIPQGGCFIETLRNNYLINAIKMCPYGKDNSTFKQIEEGRNLTAGDVLLGAAALRVLVKRVAGEGAKIWPNDWSKWILRFGSDPRYGQATSEGAKWWGWATTNEMQLARQGITGLTLSFYLKYLKNSLSGTGKENQFELRSRFLQSLHNSKKIQNARLVLNNAAYMHLPEQYRGPVNVARLHRTTDQTSMICLSCVDDIFIIEGTHTFGLRVFYRSFPINNFWENPVKFYFDKDFRISPKECPIYIRHRGDNWLNKFFYEIRTKFHIEWDDVRV